MIRSRAAAFVAYIGSFLQSYSTCIIAASLLFLAEEFGLSLKEQGKVASSILLGAIFGTLISGYLADRFGRKRTILFTALIFFSMAIGSQLITRFWIFLALRFTIGVGVGVSSMLVPMYLAEIAPAKNRGGFVSGYELSITMGVLGAYVMGYLGSLLDDWRPMFLFPVVPASIQLMLYYFLPESPKWKRENAQNKTPLFQPQYYPILVMGIILSACQQLSGFNAVLCFAPKIFAEVGFSAPHSGTFVAIFIGLVHVFATLISLFFIDRTGRRSLLILSQGGVVAFLLLIIYSFWAENVVLSLISIIAFVFFYSIGLGPVVWVLISEIFPMAIRAKAVGFLTCVSWSCSYVIIYSFPRLLDAYGTGGTLGIPLLFSIFALIFYQRYIPETKGKSLEELERSLGLKKI